MGLLYLYVFRLKTIIRRSSINLKNQGKLLLFEGSYRCDNVYVTSNNVVVEGNDVVRW